MVRQGIERVFAFFIRYGSDQPRAFKTTYKGADAARRQKGLIRDLLLGQGMPVLGQGYNDGLFLVGL